MYRLRITLFVCTLACVLGISAQPRAKAQMQRKAQQVLSQLHLQTKEQPKELKRTKHYAVYGYESGGFAIMAESELMPEVLGYADTRFTGNANPGLAWYLEQVDTLAAQVERRGMPVKKATRPDAMGFPTSVPMMVTSTWGQEEPYWKYCPQDARGVYCYTGCVATAMAQILYYHKYPPHGLGERTIDYPLNSSNPVSTVTAHFATTQYDWEHMIDSYDGAYTEEQADAVATLMLHCGVASKMNYSTNGSGTYTADAAYGLREYFGISAARSYRRSDYITSDWMDLIYGELAGGRPILYGASDPVRGFGHAFVFDGYDESGNVHVNWGWSGDDNAYYNIEVLNPQSYSFTSDHDMIIGIYGKPLDLQTATINVTKAGQLAAEISEESAITYEALTVTGNINSDDLRRLRYMAGRDASGRTTTGNLKSLDLSQARIVAGGSAFLIEGTQQYTTAVDELPARAFYGCQTLESIKLPAGLKRWGKGALAMCVSLSDVTVAPAADASFVVDGSIIYNKEKDKVLEVLPTAIGKLSIPVGVTAVDDDALSGCRKLTFVSLPSTVTTVGARAMNSCKGLTELRVYADKTVPKAGTDAFNGIDAAKCQLAVRTGMRTAFSTAAEWNVFSGNIRELYTLITPRTTLRDYGDENPEFGYTIVGDDVDGEPLLTTDATPASTVGRYTITASQGTIVDEGVEFGEGTLFVRKAPLTVRPKDTARRPGDPNPVFKLTYEGLKNGETEPEYVTEPTVTTTADELSPEGEYPIIVSGGEAVNYTLSYEAGTLVVSYDAVVDGIHGVSLSDEEAQQPIYDLNGRKVADKAHSALLRHQLPKGIYILNGRKVIIQ